MNPLALDLIDKMLDMNPVKRISVEQALQHPYLENLHDPEDEPLFEGNLDFSEFESDPTLTLVKVQRLLMRELAFYNPAYYELCAHE